MSAHTPAPTLEIIAHIRSPFPTKFGIPRQSNIVSDLTATIVFTPPYRVAEALRGIEAFDYLWLLWLFSENIRPTWSPTVRPPRLGGNRRVGVFATRSSFRPNALALSSVRLLAVDLHSADGPVLQVAGADLMDGTPIVDIKPYIPYTDAHPDARSGFAPVAADHLLQVTCADEWISRIDPAQRETLLQLLAHDPRPQYQHDPQRLYGLRFDRYDVHFRVEGSVLTVVSIDVLS